MKTVEKKTEPAGEKNLKRIHENQLMIEFSSKKKQSEHDAMRPEVCFSV